MGIMARIRDIFKPGVVEVHVGGGGLSIANMTARKMYESQPALRTVVDFVARNIASLPLKCYVRGPDGGRERDRDSAVALLLNSPNAQMTRYDLVAATVSELMLYDRFVWAVGPDTDSPSGYRLQLIPNDWISDTGGKDPWRPEWLEVMRNDAAAPLKIDAASLVMQWGYRPGDPREGSSVLKALKATLAEQAEAQAYRRDVWKRSMRINGYISRPASVEPWDPEARARFAESVRQTWAKGGERAGGTPVLEDGMSYHEVDFNPHERDWSTGVQLSREEVAAAYHVNAAVIWSRDGQTYASAKDNARALYSETLAPYLSQIEQRINASLLPMLGAPENAYVEFDLSAKLRGNFEEQISSLQTATGAPFMAREEAREILNLPHKDGLDELIVPLNVVAGGLASPTDTDPTRERYNAAPVQLVQLVGAEPPAAKGKEPVHVKVAHDDPADDEPAEQYADVLRKFYKRQARSVLAEIGAAKSRGVDAKADPFPWWHADRWDLELARDLFEVMRGHSARAAQDALMRMGFDPTTYSPGRAHAFVNSVARRIAEQINNVTRDELAAAIAGDVADDAVRSTPAGVFELASGSRADQQARTIATTVRGLSTDEAGKQAQQATGHRVTKTWVVTSSNPRPSHAALNGVEIPAGAKFSNGAAWPGDRNLSAAEKANCRCEIQMNHYFD